MRRDTIFRIASMTKPLTAACVMMLVEEGKLSLDAPVKRWLPELADRRVLSRINGPLDDTEPANRDITVRDLLAYTLGFGLLFEDSPIKREVDRQQLVIGMPVPLTPHAPDEWLKRFATLPLMHQPGEKWMYTAGSLLQGILVRRAAGQDLPAFLQERVTGPLGMKDTAFFVPADKLDRYAGAGDFTMPDGKKMRMDKDGAESAYAKPPIFPAGDAGLVSTVDDYLAFARMLLNGGVHESRRILRPETVREMTRDQISPSQKAASVNALGPGFPDMFKTRSWGFGLSVVVEADAASKVPGRFGWDGGFGTTSFADPHRKLVAIAMTQSADFLFNGARELFVEAVYTAKNRS